MKVLVLGTSGMIGSTMFRVLSEKGKWEVFGSIREGSVDELFPPNIRKRVVSGIDVLSEASLFKVLSLLRPDVVVNCAGLTKHKPEADDPLASVPINTLLPHRLARLCELMAARLVHVSTDCVFSGKKGMYVEDDLVDAQDVYGRSKALGEVTYPHTITLRTSTIGNELHTRYGLLQWFLSQQGQCTGYSRAIFSGLPTVVFAQVVRDFVIPNLTLSGLYHVAAKPINKFELLKLIAHVYGKSIDIVADDKLVLDRSLDAKRFHAATGYVAPEWVNLINMMHEYR